MNCYDRLSGERFEADDEAGVREYIADGLNHGEIVAYDVLTDDGQVFSGEVTG